MNNDIKKCRDGIFQTLKNKDPVDRKHFKLTDKLPWNIYESGVELGKHLKKFHFFHYVIKYKFIVPVCLLFDRMYEKRLKIKITDKWYDKNIRIFDEQWEKSIIDWNYKFLLHVPGNNGVKKLSVIKKNLDSKLSNVVLRSIKKMIILGYLLDTAYREFGNILMFNLSKRMQKEYADKKNYHLFYTSKTASDVQYLILGQHLDINHVELYKVDRRGKSRMCIKR